MSLQLPEDWQEDSPGTYSRALDELELCYLTNIKVWSGSGHTASAITAHIGFSIDLSPSESITESRSCIENSLRYAWKKIRYHCPLLATSIEYDSSNKTARRIYQTPDSKDLHDWMNKSFTIIRTRQTSHEFVCSDPSVPHAAIFVFPVTLSEETEKKKIEYSIIFRCGHDVMDGMATYSVLHNLLRHTSLSFPSPFELEVDFGEEYKNLSPPLRTLLNLPNTPSTEEDLAPIRAQRVLDRASAFSVPYKQGKTVPGCTHRAALHFTVEETKAILAACKTHSTTVTQVFHSGIALATRDFQTPSPDVKEGKYVGYVIMNLRKFCKEPYNGPEYSMMLCHTNSTSSLIVRMSLPENISPTRKQSPEEFRQVLEQVKSFYIRHSTPDLMSAPLCFAARTPAYPTSGPLLVPAPSSAPSASLSSRGITDNFIRHNYGPFEVLDPWAVGTEQSPGYGVSLATWKGKFALRAAYNEAFHDIGEVDDFLESVKRVVLQGLGIE